MNYFYTTQVSSLNSQVIDNLVTLSCTNPNMQMHYIADCDGVLRIVQSKQFSSCLSLFPILDKEATFVKDRLPIQNENERKIVAFSSSSTEIFDFATKLSALLPVINCLLDFVCSMDKLICNKQFSRDEYDHHIDFISAQDIIYDKLKYIEDILPRRLEKHTN